jgi:hypothetical protein
MADRKYTVSGGYYKPDTAEYENFLNIIQSQNPGIAPYGVHGVYLPKTKDVAESNYIPARRANPKNKYGAKDRMETQDVGYDKETLGNLLAAYKAAAHGHGVKMLHPDDLANMALVEGRSNFGYNAYNQNNPRAAKIVKDLVAQGHDPYAAGFPAAIVDKQMQSERLKLPFYQVWNGSGPAAKKYAQRIAAEKYAVEDPRNKSLRDYIRNAIGYKDPAEQVALAEPAYKHGGAINMPDAYSQGNWKLI